MEIKDEMTEVWTMLSEIESILINSVPETSSSSGNYYSDCDSLCIYPFGM